jgi:DNA-directed RNA polymerase subunit RPC12/RpoP
MGLFDFLKKKTKEATDIVPLSRTKSKLDNKHTTTNNKSSAIIVKPDTVAPEVLKLLWFVDGPFKNYSNSVKNKFSFNVEGFTIYISFMGSEEPSAISTVLPIAKPIELEKIERPKYYPSYSSLSPQQRWIYLNWLKDVDKEINIGYVFIFYYGIERHLFFGDAEAAFDMILRLRKTHKNASFMSYSSNALLASCLFHRRTDWFLKYINSITEVDEIAVDDIYLLAKQAMGMGLTAKELMSLAKDVGFTNRRYIKDEGFIFEQELNNLLVQKFSIKEMSLSSFILKKCPTVQQTILANYSISSDQRVIKIPSIIGNQAFSDIVLELLQGTHDSVKILLKELRKSGRYIPQEQKLVNKATKEIDDIFKKSPLFEAIDTHIFDNNIMFFNEGVCPYCKSLLQKIPSQKGKCNSCNNRILVKNSVFTGEKLIMTEDEYNIMAKIRNERTYRNWVKTMLSYEGIDISLFAKKVVDTGITIEEELIQSIISNSEKYYKDSNMGLYRNTLMHIGNVYEKMEQREKALNMYLLVCYYDLRGCTNGERRFDKKLAFLAPAVLSWIGKLGDELNLSKEIMKDKYIIAVKQIKDRPMASVIDSTWCELEETLYREI